MKGNRFRRYGGACLLAAVTLTGCQLASRQPASSPPSGRCPPPDLSQAALPAAPGTPAGAPAAPPPGRPAVGVAVFPYPVPADRQNQTRGPAPGVLLPEPAQAQRGEATPAAGPGGPPGVCEWRPASDPGPVETAPRPDPFVRQAALPEPAADARPAPARPAAEAPRPFPPDLPPPGLSGHAEDYSWLSGEVEYWRVARGWRLCYASPSEKDAYGGSVTLVAQGQQLAALKDGQRVMVRGRLVNPGSRGAAVQYEVESIQPLPR